MKKSKSIIFGLILCMSLPVIANAATSYENGALKYDGYQDDDKVYSKIWDAKTTFKNTTGDGRAWAVKASVKVGGSTYTSDWRYGTASKSADRVWHADETSYFDYDELTTMKEYTKDNWGEEY